VFTQAQWNALLRVSDCPGSLLIGDFNSHNFTWNCPTTDANGERFESSLDKYDLFLHNRDTLTYIDVRRNYRSNLDLH